MARDPVDLVTEAFGLLNSDEYEKALPLIDERFEMVTTAEVASEPGTYRGREGVRRWWLSFLDAMDAVWLEAHHVHPVDDGRAIVEFSIHARGRTSGIEAAQPATALATVADDRLLRLEFFTSLERARAAAGLPPS